jgi:hypothetical protein
MVQSKLYFYYCITNKEVQDEYILKEHRILRKVTVDDPGILTPESGRRLPLQDQEIAPLTIPNRVPALSKLVPAIGECLRKPNGYIMLYKDSLIYPYNYVFLAPNLPAIV